MSLSQHIVSNFHDLSFFFFQVEDLKAKLAVQEVELWQRNTDIEALIAKIGQQTEKLNLERAVADAEEQRVRVCDSRAFQATLSGKRSTEIR